MVFPHLSDFAQSGRARRRRSGSAQRPLRPRVAGDHGGHRRVGTRREV